ncbi:uncharacterized protein LOC117114663 [Anneissia japonica]|uniref:uncharacterized protein LOC117114663 n=1 Tax=Anneissia japonica TaxID=1529436 RepID=UPI0014254BB7|nr:uncharacterized protein LOC117114663 [Anneissia japonica]XP_033114248.1 uncharacterized protein LOC117114663 [Anneissia japonica]XP_033114249.1 uncharacterized protein LOC117114663 [Anneissia japonica]XP_033114250.1 uncharacterized protein LOC117114663 [Anneissia japonica]XP_033114251.1 uncharacterized protein LOC117114663 [Anneissia japonica]
MNVLTQSEKHRQCGNGYYRSVTPGLSPLLQKSRLEQAKQCYTDALKCSSTTEEAASANKNLAMTSWKLASLGQEQKDLRSQIVFFHKDALKYFSRALRFGNDAHIGQSWSESLVQKMHQSLQECLDFVNNQTNMSDEKTDILSMACQLIPAGEFKANISILYVEHLIGKAIDLFQDRKCLSILYDCHQPLEEAKRYGRSNKDILSEVGVMSEEVTMLTAVAEARQALETGDSLKKKILTTEEDLNIDMVWEVLDWYKKAILLTREKNLELEAIAMCRMGIIYDSMLKLKSKARPYFK